MSLLVCFSLQLHFCLLQAEFRNLTSFTLSQQDVTFLFSNFPNEHLPNKGIAFDKLTAEHKKIFLVLLSVSSQLSFDYGPPHRYINK